LGNEKKRENGCGTKQSGPFFFFFFFSLFFLILFPLYSIYNKGEPFFSTSDKKEIYFFFQMYTHKRE